MPSPDEHLKPRQPPTPGGGTLPPIPGDEAIIPLAVDTPALPRIPSADELAQYRALAAPLESGGKIALATLHAITRAGFHLRARIGGDGSGSGALGELETRRDRAAQIAAVLSRAEAVITGLYVEPPAQILRGVAADLAARLATRTSSISSAYAGGGIAAALEETRLMVVFAGRALKSEDHIHGTIAGLKERSFAAEPRSTPELKQGSERSSDDRLAAFQARQAERAKLSEAKRAASKGGGALPVRGAPADTPVTEGQRGEKEELVAHAAAQQRGIFESARPTEAQKHLLRQRSPREITTRSPKPPDGMNRTGDGIESLRIELTNDTASLLKEWLAAEVALAAELGQPALDLPNLPTSSTAAGARQEKLAREGRVLEEALRAIERDLKRIGRSVLEAKSLPALQRIFTPADFTALQRLLEPVKEIETYELLDP